MASTAARLILGYGTADSQEFLLTSQTATLGRETINDIVIRDPEVSRRHVRFTQLAGRFIIEDLGSTNGTYLNGQRISAPSPLLNGDVIDLGGSIRLTFFGPPGAAEATIIEKPGAESDALPTAVSPQPAEMPPGGVPTAPAQVQPASSTAPPQPAVPPPHEAPQPEKRNWQRYIIGCGCIVILAVIACGVTLFLLDLYASDVLYCGPLQFIFEPLGASCP